MSGEPQLFRINPENQQSDRIEEVDFTQLGLKERWDIQDWVVKNPGILGDDLLIIGKEFSDFDLTNERLDLLAVDWDGRLVIIELKRDDSGADAYWQAIKYASYFTKTTKEQIVDLASNYLSESKEQAFDRLLEHLDADDLSALNNDQRIILASHRFAPEVTSAALWLNQKVPTEDLITCVKLTPFHDTQTKSLYVQASTIIPVPGVDVVSVVSGVRPESGGIGISFAAKRRKTFERNKNDEVTQFLRKAGQLATDGLADEIRPDRTSQLGGVHRWGGRYYRLWYEHPPWDNHGHSYQIDLHPQDGEGEWLANLYFGYRDDIAELLEGVVVHSQQRFGKNWIEVDVGPSALDDKFAGEIAEVIRSFIERITPIIDVLENETGNDESQPAASC